MPIEIRELVIRATVDPSSNGSGSASCGSAADSGAHAGSSGAGGGSGANDQLVQSCVREVMRILEEKRER